MIWTFSDSDYPEKGELMLQFRLIAENASDGFAVIAWCIKPWRVEAAHPPEHTTAPTGWFLTGNHQNPIYNRTPEVSVRFFLCWFVTLEYQKNRLLSINRRLILCLLKRIFSEKRRGNCFPCKFHKCTTIRCPTKRALVRSLKWLCFNVYDMSTKEICKHELFMIILLTLWNILLPSGDGFVGHTHLFSQRQLGLFLFLCESGWSGYWGAFPHGGFLLWMVSLLWPHCTPIPWVLNRKEVSPPRPSVESQ